MPKWLKWTLTTIVFIGVTALLYFVGFKGDWIQPVVTKAGWLGYIIYIFIQVIMTTLLCFVPATTFTFALLSVQIFGTTTGLMLSIIGCWLSSMVMFIVGKYGGTKLVDWLVGKEDRIKAQKLVSDRATVLVPVMLACPFFPDDAICMVSGMTKMKFGYFSIMALLTRSIGITLTALLGNDVVVSYILNTLGNNVVLWVMFINLILFDIYAIWKISGKFEALIKRYRTKKLLKQTQQINEIKDTTEEIIENNETSENKTV